MHVLKLRNRVCERSQSVAIFKAALVPEGGDKMPIKRSEHQFANEWAQNGSYICDLEICDNTAIKQLR